MCCPCIPGNRAGTGTRIQLSLREAWDKLRQIPKSRAGTGPARSSLPWRILGPEAFTGEWVGKTKAKMTPEIQIGQGRLMERSTDIQSYMAWGNSNRNASLGSNCVLRIWRSYEAMRKTRFSSTKSANSLLQQVITGSQTSGCSSREVQGEGIEAAAVYEIVWGYIMF